MLNFVPPKLGLLGIMQELYDASYPDITERQGKFAKEIVKHLKIMDIVIGS